MEVTIYSTPNCQYCVKVKEWFKSRDYPFTEIDVASDVEARKEMVAMTGRTGVPVIRLAGYESKLGDHVDHVLVGFDEKKLEELWQNKK